jgi:hypothetical protein
VFIAGTSSNIYNNNNNKEKASRQTHTQETTKINEEKQNRKNTNGNVQSVTTCKKGQKPAKQIPSVI